MLYFFSPVRVCYGLTFGLTFREPKVNIKMGKIQAGTGTPQEPQANLLSRKDGKESLPLRRLCTNLSPGVMLSRATIDKAGRRLRN